MLRKRRESKSRLVWSRRSRRFRKRFRRWMCRISMWPIPTQNPGNGEAEFDSHARGSAGVSWRGLARSVPAVLPEDVVHTLERQGHEVVQQRRLVPFQAADGSRVVFPVDEVEVLPGEEAGVSVTGGGRLFKVRMRRSGLQGWRLEGCGLGVSVAVGSTLRYGLQPTVFIL